ncbi:DUF2208 domain-containing protein [Hyperthermus butylicus]|uniref:Conserved crenarchaeal protein n=1 Tax=Hyperthermus butylicus (strain DSM 5456 / JCM 9403 / PLM1-5) TaxID=415426 RepID=A2BLU5_HYPBU|nr:DUF2208 domain-containing protein [Hyperthermus butylicus]ABM80956.1 conserved crenarchaeal protein [Hyperthermus butylicus DSM 5456]
MLDTRSMMLVSQVYFVILAMVLAIAPQYYMLVFLIYFVAIMAFSMYTSKRRMKGARIPREEVEAARQLFREDNSFQIAVEDEELVRQLTGQAKTAIMTFLFLPIYITIFELVRRNYSSLISALQGAGLSETLAGFVVWFAAFETMFLISMVSRRVVRQAKQPPMVPRGFVVTEKGILLKGSMGGVIGFPLPEGTEVKLDEKRNCVEIVFPGGSRLRLYTRKARRVYELIQRLGLRGAKTGGSG